MNLIDEKVQHSQFGIGRITSNSGNIIKVEFDEDTGEKKFSYPEAFESYLQMCNPESQEYVSKKLGELHKEISKERIEKELERLRDAEKMSLEKAALKKAALKKKAAEKLAAKKLNI